MKKRDRHAESAETVFPFLAVLLCGVGTLVVLLLVTVLQTKASATQVAIARADREKREDASAEQVRQAIEDARWRIEILEASREKTAEQLDLKRRELSHLEDEIRRIRDQLDLAAAEAEQIEKAAGSESTEVDAARERLSALQDELKKALADLEQARNDRSKDKPAYAIVPYDGPHGTRRQPIYVECLAEKVIFQPEGLELNAEDFEEPMTDDNPLAAALRAKREYLKDVTGESESLAYPLLIVRPSGAHSYAAARAAMKSWETEFGYELVEDELPLAYPEKDPSLDEVMQVAVDEARARRRYLKLIAPARFGRRESPSLLTASGSGGFVTPDGQSAGRAARRRGGSGVPGGGQVAAMGPEISNQGNGMAGGLGTRSGSGGLPLRDSSGDSNGLSTAANDGSPGGRGRGGAGGSGKRASATAGQDGLATEDAWGGDGSGDGGETAAAGSSRANGNRANGAGRAGDGSGAESDKEANESDSQPLKGPANGQFANHGSGKGSGNAGENGSTASGVSPGGQQGNGSRSGTGRSGRGSFANQGGGSRPTGNGSAMNGSPAGGAAGGAGGAGGAAGGGSSAGSSGGGAVSLGMGSPGPASAAMAAGRRSRGGGNWGLPESSVGLTGITRPISVTCSADELVLLPEKRSRMQPTVVQVDGLLSEQIDELVSKIWQRMDGWGTAGENMYWKPVLQVKVTENGDSMYQELARLLQDSGIDVIRK